MGGHTLLARLDNAGDVLLTGPAVRAVAAGSDRVTLLCGPGGADAARMLPGVDEVITWRAPWVGFDEHRVDPAEVGWLVERLGAAEIDRAAVCTSFHQSALPLALLLRLAGITAIAAMSEDFPGALLDHRRPFRPELHEVEQALDTVGALGFALPAGDDGRLRVRPVGALPPGTPQHPYVVLHAGASVPARSVPDALVGPSVEALTGEGWIVVVTGGPGDPRPRPQDGLVDLVGRTTFRQLGALLAGAAVLVCGNTGPAHLAAAVGTPVVSVFAPVVPWHRWRPWGVPSVPLGTQDIACAGCRARSCPLPGQPCLEPVSPSALVAAVGALAGERSDGPPPRPRVGAAGDSR